jgi:hypothetical protein
LSDSGVPLRLDNLRRALTTKQLPNLYAIDEERTAAALRSGTSGHMSLNKMVKPDWTLTGAVIDWPDGKPAALSQSAWQETPLGWT